MANISKKQRAEEQAIALRAQNTSIREIAQQTGLSEMEVVDIIEEADYKIITLSGIEKEAALRKQGATRSQRLQRLCSLRDKLIGEIEERGLKDIPTEKLLSLYLKTEEAVERNYSIPVAYASSQMNWQGEKIVLTD